MHGLLSLSSTQLSLPFWCHKFEAGGSKIGAGSGERGLGFRKWRRGRLTVCGMEEARSLLQESGNKKRAARTVASVVQRVERAQEEMERRAMRRKATRLYPHALLGSLDERIRQNSWDSALKVPFYFYVPQFVLLVESVKSYGSLSVLCMKADSFNSLSLPSY